MTARAILQDIGPLLTQLEALGLRIVASHYDERSFGDYYVDLEGPRGSFRISRDRGQYLIDGDIGRIRAMGLLRAFDHAPDFAGKVLEYAATVV
jgi:hypothetical protein